jgi:hypothetical protein
MKNRHLITISFHFLNQMTKRQTRQQAATRNLFIILAYNIVDFTIFWFPADKESNQTAEHLRGFFFQGFFPGFSPRSLHLRYVVTNLPTQHMDGRRHSL